MESYCIHVPNVLAQNNFLHGSRDLSMELGTNSCTKKLHMYVIVIVISISDLEYPVMQCDVEQRSEETEQPGL
jgi:hypothetical protein